MMPHLSRWLVGADHRWSLPVTLIATLSCFCSPISWPYSGAGELRVSVVSAFIGAPVLELFWFALGAEVACDRPRPVA